MRESRKKTKLKDPKNEFSELTQKILACKLCRLSQNRINAVPGSGRLRDLDLMLVGEGPGKKEDLQGEPFVGRGGKVLDATLALAGLDRSNVFVTNIVKCRPPKNRKPLEDEIEICASNYLEHQLDLLKPKLICTLGATALNYFTGEKSMGAARGKLTRSRKGIPLLPTYHPAAILRNPSLKPFLEHDIRKISSILKQIKKARQNSRSLLKLAPHASEKLQSGT